jgi:steroid delta-isomerase-like uncharacterized protein
MHEVLQHTRREEVIIDIIDAVNVHNIDRLVQLCAPNYEGIDVSQSEPQIGREGARATIQMYFSAFPDLRVVQYEAMLDGDRAIIVWTAQGTHRGPIMHIPPTGRVVTVCGTSLLHLAGGKVRRSELIWDVAAMLRELGLLPEL